jgi:mannose-6-phosphate isomerase-like protein (cupin superfamily)
LGGGANQPNDISPELSIQHFSSVKKVVKPWGFELWLSDASDTPYAMKIIYLMQGAKTSLQLHKKKSEHNCIFSGKARVYYESTEDGAVKSVDLEAGHVVKVLPNTVHRVEALTNLVLIEASSPELDDVVRLADDYRRPDGKIESEHDTAH